MMFDPKTYELRQWTITDAQGKDTTVMIFNVKQGVKIDPGAVQDRLQAQLRAQQRKKRQCANR